MNCIVRKRKQIDIALFRWRYCTSKPNTAKWIVIYTLMPHCTITTHMFWEIVDLFPICIVQCIIQHIIQCILCFGDKSTIGLSISPSWIVFFPIVKRSFPGYNGSINLLQSECIMWIYLGLSSSGHAGLYYVGSSDWLVFPQWDTSCNS